MTSRFRRRKMRPIIVNESPRYEALRSLFSTSAITILFYIECRYNLLFFCHFLGFNLHNLVRFPVYIHFDGLSRLGEDFDRADHLAFLLLHGAFDDAPRSEERRVGKE